MEPQGQEARIQDTQGQEERVVEEQEEFLTKRHRQKRREPQKGKHYSKSEMGREK